MALDGRLVGDSAHGWYLDSVICKLVAVFWLFLGQRDGIGTERTRHPLYSSAGSFTVAGPVIRFGSCGMMSCPRHSSATEQHHRIRSSSTPPDNTGSSILLATDSLRTVNGTSICVEFTVRARRCLLVRATASGQSAEAPHAQVRLSMSPATARGETFEVADASGCD